MSKLSIILLLLLLSSCNNNLFITYKRAGFKLEKIKIKQLEKIEKGKVKLTANQKIVSMNGTDSSKIFEIETRNSNNLSNIRISKKHRQFISIEKTLIKGDTTEYYSYHPSGWLKQKKMFLVTPWVESPVSKFFFDHVRIGVEYTGSKNGKLLFKIDYHKVFNYSLDSIIQYCKTNFPDSRSISVNTYYYQDTNFINPVQAKTIRTVYPYWSLWVEKKCDSLVTRPMTTCFNTYLLDGKTGKILLQSPLNFTPAMGQTFKKKN